MTKFILRAQRCFIEKRPRGCIQIETFQWQTICRLSGNVRSYMPFVRQRRIIYAFCQVMSGYVRRRHILNMPYDKRHTLNEFVR